MNAHYPIIRRRIRGIELVRSARGFSKAELKEAGFSSISFARKKGISVDELRKTTGVRECGKTQVNSEGILKY
jgi:ribosomal protein L13E